MRKDMVKPVSKYNATFAWREQGKLGKDSIRTSRPTYE
jgi:hypothetical protein